MLQRKPNFLMSVITGDETWGHQFDPLTKIASSASKHTNSRKNILQTKSADKVMMNIFFNHKGFFSSPSYYVWGTFVTMQIFGFRI